jgi:hypothetical protein
MDTSPAALFREPPVIRFTASKERCLCGKRLLVQKSRRKKVLRMTGPFIVHETVSYCPGCGSVFGSDALRKLVPARSNVAYDVMVFVGRALFQRNRTTEETRTELAARNVLLSASEIDYLGRKFILYLARAHQQATVRICEAMTLAGGYILHLDATHAGNAPALMTGLDGLSKIVLANVKIPTEHTEHIVPFLKEIKEAYGTPIACVHDMGGGICKGVREVFVGVPDFICHFHFLRDIGKDLLDPAYGKLRNLLRTHSISTKLSTLVREVRRAVCGQSSDPTKLAKAIKSPNEKLPLLSLVSAYCLALWALNGKNNGDGYGFPFDRPLLAFTEHLLELDREMPRLMKLSVNDEQNNIQYLFKLSWAVSDVAEDQEVQRLVRELRWRCRLFDSLRKAMRIALPGGGNGLNDEGTAIEMSSIREDVMKFRCRLEEDSRLASDPLCSKMARQIDKYRDKLFAEPIHVNTPEGPSIVSPQRTNNILEHLFRDLNRRNRRKTGNNSMQRLLKTMLADTPLVKNLDNPDYMTLILGGKASIEELFASMESVNLKNEIASKPTAECVLPGFRKIITTPDLPEHLMRLAVYEQHMERPN